MRKKESEHDDEEEETNKPLTLIYEERSRTELRVSNVQWHSLL